MNDDDLRRLLRNSLTNRRAPEGAWERARAALAGRSRLRLRPIFGLAAAVALLVVGAAGTWRRAAPEPSGLPDVIAAAMERHEDSDAPGHGVQALSPREMAARMQETSGFSIELPGLRDAGFDALEQHRCQGSDWNHVIYKNSWTRLSCFVLADARLELTGGDRSVEDGVERVLYTRGETAAVAVRHGKVVKVWVSDLRPRQLARIAVDVELKRNTMMTVVISGVEAQIARAFETLIRSIPGVEDVRVDAAKREGYVMFDPRRVSDAEIGAVAVLNGMADGLQSWTEER